MSSSEDVYIHYVEQPTNVVPAAATWNQVPGITSEALTVTPSRVASQASRSDAQQEIGSVASTSSGGPINIEFAPEVFDDFILGMVRANSWTNIPSPALGITETGDYNATSSTITAAPATFVTDGFISGDPVLVTGLGPDPILAFVGVVTETTMALAPNDKLKVLTDQTGILIGIQRPAPTVYERIRHDNNNIYYAMEKGYGAPGSIMFLRQAPSEMTLDMTAGELVTGSFTFVGATANASTAPTQKDGAATINPLPASKAFVMADLPYVSRDGEVLLDVCITALSFNLTNNVRSVLCAGSKTPGDAVFGVQAVTGSISFLLNQTVMDLFVDGVNDVELDIQFALYQEATGASYQFHMPRTVLVGDAPSKEGANTDVVYTAAFEAGPPRTTTGPTGHSQIQIIRRRA